MKKKLNSVVFEVTSKCNLGCQYCYNIHKIPGGPGGPPNTYKGALKTLKRLFRVADVDRITMTGGEPFLAERFPEIVLFCRMKGKRVIVISNGTSATRKDYECMIDLGVSTFEFPLHSVDPREHDAMTRRKGSHEKARRSIELVRDLGGTVVPMIVITKINAKNVGDTLLLFKQLGFRQIMLNRFNIGGRGITRADALSLSHNELRHVFEAANDMAIKCGLKITSNVCTPVCVLDPARYPRIGFSVCSGDIDRRPLTMDINGNMRFCNHSPVNMGNIYRDKLENILTSDYARSWQSSVPPYCADCKLWSKCFGGCRAASEQIGLSVAHVDPILQNTGTG